MIGKMRTVEIYIGKEIDKEKITRIKQIAASRYASPIYKSYFSNINDLDDLHDIDINDEILILGKDWFLCCTVSRNTVAILEWIAIDDKKTKIIQSIEMMKVFKELMLQYKDKLFTAHMRHNTSYQFYLRMLEKGYFNECLHIIEIDACYGFEIERLKYLEYDYNRSEDFLNIPEFKEHPEYLTYVLHCLAFCVTDEFVNKYEKSKKFNLNL